jgi:hypothetical protein
VKAHAIFLRAGCALPDRFFLQQERFCQDWMLVEGLAAVTLDAKIRGAGWHFMWMLGSNCRRGCGRTREGAIHQALERALKTIARQFNASELDSFLVKKYLGFHIAKVTLHPRQIQKQTSLQVANA